MKHEWKKSEKEIYLPKNKPQIVDIPAYGYFTLSGEGNPNGEAFGEAIGVLYSLSYAIRMLNKAEKQPEGYYEYTVYPLEGIWDLTDEGRVKDKLDKDELIYKIMIRQPDFVTDEVVEYAFNTVRKKKPHPLLDQVKFERINEGLSVQMMHIGPYDDEPKTFAEMKKFIEENNLKIKSLAHKEIYISDFRKTAAEKLKTVLRYGVIRQ